MKQRIAIMMALIMALAGLAPPRTVEAHRLSGSFFSDRTVEAFFTSTDGSGCVITNVFVFATKSRSYSSSGLPQRGASATLTITQDNVCTNTALLLDGSAALSSRSLQFSLDLRTATLQTTIVVCNPEAPDDCRNVMVNLTWRGRGSLVLQHNYSRETLNDCTIISQSYGFTRQAVASGYVYAAMTNFTPTPSIPADTRIVLALRGDLTVCA